MTRVSAVAPCRKGDLLALPKIEQPLAPRGLQAREVGVRTAEQQHIGHQGVSPREHRKILQNDGMKERCHQVALGNALFLKPGDVGLREDTALSGYGINMGVLIFRGE